MDNVFIEESKMQSIIDEMRVQKDKLEELFNKITADGETMTTFWSGNTGDDVYESYSEHTKTYADTLNYFE